MPRPRPIKAFFYVELEEIGSCFFKACEWGLPAAIFFLFSLHREYLPAVGKNKDNIDKWVEAASGNL